MRIDVLRDWDVGERIGQLRAVPVRMGGGSAPGLLLVHSACFDVDPSPDMFFYPTDTLKLTFIGPDGETVWKRDLGPGTPPGVWFCPVFPFDLDGEGRESLWLVANVEPRHPLALKHYRLMRLDAATGKTLGEWPWPAHTQDQPLYMAYRHFLCGGHADGRPVLVTAQGTYSDMFLQGHGPGMEKLWELRIAREAPGARGSHMCPVVDLDGDGDDELLWGERCIRLANGREMFCADSDSYRGHSDIIQPVLDRASGAWSFLACRENRPESSPRVLVYDARGQRVWGEVEWGHMDMGWAAHLSETGPTAMAIRIGAKSCGPDGREHFDRDEFAFDAVTGRAMALPFPLYRTLPVDLDGDGLHAVVRGLPGGDGRIWDAEGRKLGTVGGTVALAAKFLARPGEQLLAYYADGRVRAWGDADAEDGEAASKRYSHPFYAASLRLMAVGYHGGLLGGL